MGSDLQNLHNFKKVACLLFLLGLIFVTMGPDLQNLHNFNADGSDL